MSDRYTGRHIHQARHTASAMRRRTRPQSANLKPAAVLALVGALVAGTGATMRITELVDQHHPVGLAANYDPADYLPADGEAQIVAQDQNAVRAAALQQQSAAALQPVLAVSSSGTCKASYNNQGGRTASGETFNPAAMTAASRTLPFNTLVRVTNTANGKAEIVRINDRGPYVSGRCLSLSSGAFAAIASLGTGVVNVKYEVLAQNQS